MASYSSAQREYNSLEARFRQLSAQFTSIQREVQNGASVSNIAPSVLRLRNSIEVQIAFVQRLQDVTIPDINDAPGATIEQLYNDTGNLRDQYNELLDATFELTDQAAKNDRQRNLLDNQSVNSSSAENQQDDDAEQEGAATQSPSAVATVLDNDNNVVPESTRRDTPNNATEKQLSDDTNLEGRGTSTVGGNTSTVKQTQTQSGQVSASDDQVTAPRSTVGITSGVDDRPTIAAEFLNQIVPTDNRLKTLASMTYSLSIYLMNADEYRSMLNSQRKVLPSDQLIIQSGGIPFNDDRNGWFLEDFYIEDLYIQSIVGTQGTGAPHNVADMKFTVVEPNGITFLNRLNNAVKDHTGNSEENELSQNYLMVIRFYGYDDNGELVSGNQLGFSEVGSDPRSLVEKFIPFQIADIKYKIATRNVEYNITATIPQTNIGFSQGRATIPFNMQLVAADVQTLLNGNLLLANEVDLDDEGTLNNLAPGKSPLSGATITQGLADALNKHQELLVKKGAVEFADVFEIELANISGLRDAKMAKPGKQNKKRAPMNTSSDPANKFLSSKTRFDKESKTYNITAGTQIVQLIDLVMRSSSYITSQQNIIFDEVTGDIKNQDPVRTVQWYRIRCQVTPMNYDNLRRDYAYKIKYTVTPYQINTPRSAYFPPSAYRGVHKVYDYWFTGENTEVLDFEVNVNANYLTIIGNDGLSDNTASGRWFEKRVFQARPNASSQGGEGETTMPAASLSSRLYNMTDVADATLDIVGDPDWIQQSEIFYNKDYTLTPFLTDGSVNYDSSEVLYELRFNPVNDYDLGTGLTPVYQNNTTQSGVTGEFNLPQESIVWAAAIVHNYFKEGQFTQQLVGTIRDFKPAVDSILGTNRSNTAVQTKTETTKTTPKPEIKESGGPKKIGNASNAINRARAQAQRIQLTNNADDDAGTETETNVTGGRSRAAARRAARTGR